MNLDRVRYQRAYEHLLALAALKSNENLPRVWADAVARFEAGIDDLEYDLNEPRREARTIAEVSLGRRF